MEKSTQAGKYLENLQGKRSLSQKCVGYGMNESSGICIKGISEDWKLGLMGRSQIIQDFRKTKKNTILYYKVKKED